MSLSAALPSAREVRDTVVTKMPFGSLIASVENGVLTVVAVPGQAKMAAAEALRSRLAAARETPLGGVGIGFVERVTGVSFSLGVAPTAAMTTETGLADAPDARGFYPLTANQAGSSSTAVVGQRLNVDPKELSRRRRSRTTAAAANKEERSAATLRKALRLLAEARTTSPSRLISRVLFYLAEMLGNGGVDEIEFENVMRAAVAEARASGAYVVPFASSSGDAAAFEYRMAVQDQDGPLARLRGSDTVTGVVLSYREVRPHESLAHEDKLAKRAAADEHARRKHIRKALHYPEMDLTLFETTVYLPRRNSFSDTPGQVREVRLLDDAEDEWAFNQGRLLGDRSDGVDEDDLQSVSSIPAANVNLQREALAAADASLNALWEVGGVDPGAEALLVQGPKHLKHSASPLSFPPDASQRERILEDFQDFTDDVLYRARDHLRSAKQKRRRLGTFNPLDSHNDLVLSCGAHCVHRPDGASPRTLDLAARSALACEPGRRTYFEIAFEPMTDETLALDVAVGVSTKRAVLNARVGTTRYSVGYRSTGHVGTGSSSEVEVGRPLDVHSVVRVCVDATAEPRSTRRAVSDVRSVRVWFLADLEQPIVLTEDVFDVPVSLKLYPTISLGRDAKHRAFAHFAPDDVAYGPPEDGHEWYAVDGAPFSSSSSQPKSRKNET